MDELTRTRFAAILPALNTLLRSACPDGQRLVLLVLEPGQHLSIISNWAEPLEVLTMLRAGVGQVESEIGGTPGNGGTPTTH